MTDPEPQTTMATVQGLTRFSKQTTSILKNTPQILRKTRFKPKLPKLNIEIPTNDTLKSLNNSNSDSNFNDSFQDSDSSSSTVGTCIIPEKLYLTDLSNAQDINFLQTNKITAIISLYAHALPQQIVDFVSRKNYFHIPIRDNCSENISRYFQDCINFIDNNQTVLVHCQAGISRSPTIVMAYLMSKMTFGWKEACEFVQERRSIVAPNFSFVGQLFKYETKVKELCRHGKFEKYTDKYKEKFKDIEIRNISDTFKNSFVEKYHDYRPEKKCEN